ncbi:MAG: ATP-binding protein [Phycisphaerales bacterium]|nr:MAG: ATP-binding protein [Phycisphaerales bacterium]
MAGYDEVPSATSGPVRYHGNTLSKKVLALREISETASDFSDMIRSMVPRGRHLTAVRRLLRQFPIVAILGARQVGKTTLALELLKRAKPSGERFDLEDPADLARLSDAKLALADHKGLVIIDEIQRRPDIFPVLRVLADRRPRRARFLVLGSASPELLRQSSETLAGRIAFHNLDGFHLDEVGVNRLDRLWLRGGFPLSFLARTHYASFTWRQSFIRTFLERDLPQLGVRVPAATLSRFWSMLAHYHGQVWNGAEFARSFGVSDKTVRHYLDTLQAAQVAKVLQPWHENVRKRQVKSPKVYVRDSGLLHGLLGIRERRDLDRHPKVGASWEGFLLQQVVDHVGASPEECFFWATHSGAELDLLWIRGRRRWGFEFKRTSSPKFTSSLHTAIDTLGLQKAFLVHAGDKTFPLRKRVAAVAATRLLEDID